MRVELIFQAGKNVSKRVYEGENILLIHPSFNASLNYPARSMDNYRVVVDDMTKIIINSTDFMSFEFIL
jgi:hypothetical protein